MVRHRELEGMDSKMCESSISIEITKGNVRGFRRKLYG